MKVRTLALASGVILTATTASFAQSLPNFGAYPPGYGDSYTKMSGAYPPIGYGTDRMTILWYGGYAYAPRPYWRGHYQYPRRYWHRRYWW